MIIVRLIGGLGNQLFQYAVARHLAEIHRTVVKIDISGFEKYKLHKYSLWPFNIQENFAFSDEVAALTGHKRSGWQRAIRQMLPITSKSPKTYIRQKYYHFDSDILNLPDNVYLDGYWQNERYFIDIAEIIRREFTVKTPQRGFDREFGELICPCESISIHIRRQDYVNNPDTKKYHGVCGLDYYLDCVETLTKTLKSPHFFVFSDDPKWAQDNLQLLYPITYISHNGPDKNYEDLRLMSQCKHHIIANSTFSWWGAWLSTHKENFVFAPKKWFAKSDINTEDLIPSGWIKK